MIMYKIKCLENRVKVFKDDVEFIEMDAVSTCKNFIQDHKELLDALDTLTEDTLEKILSVYNADFRGKQYRLNKVGELVKNNEGQLSLW